MSNTLGHGLLQRVLLPPHVIENQNRTHPGFSGSVLSGVPSGSKADHGAHQKCKPILSSRFLGNSLRGNHRAGYMVTRAVLATEPSAELAGKFNLDVNSELQVSVQAPASGSATKIDFRVTYGHELLVLHWGALREGNKDWALPFRRPDGTKVYKNKALRTPFMKSGHDSLLNIEIDDPEIQAIEFLILDEAQNRWFKNNGTNFQLKLSVIDHHSLKVSIEESTTFSVPEDLVQTNAYLRWERKGKQSYKPEQEKEEYEAARSELLEELNRGISIEELRTKLMKMPDDAKKDDAKKADPKNAVAVRSEIPDDLVQVQAYIRWERAGKPNYSPEKQLMEFEEARKELQHELGKGASLTELRQKLMKGNIQSKVSTQLKTKKYFTLERIQRKKRDIMQLLNKYFPESPPEYVVSTPKTPTAMEALSKELEDQDSGRLLNKKIFKIGDKELLVLVTNPHGKTKVCLTTDQKGPACSSLGIV